MDGHDQRNERAPGAMGCPDCRGDLQDYLDGTLEKKRSLAVFLHLRECEGCRVEHDTLCAVFSRLNALPGVEAPADFDAAVLASVPYDAYRAMEPLRRERVPVFLEDTFLPAWVRARVTRLAGLAVAAGAGGVWLGAPDRGWLLAVFAAGLLPEALVLLQGVGRRLVGLRRAEG
jgi:anti-sigma factor RsiW